MSTIAVLGVTGYLGRLVLGELAAQQGTTVVPVARDARAAAAVVREVGLDVDEIRMVEASSGGSLRAALEGVDLAIGAFGPVAGSFGGLFEASIEAGVHLVDLTCLPAPARAAFEDHDRRARATGVSIVPGATAEGVVGDLLADVAGSAVEGPSEVHVASTTLSRTDRPVPWPRSLLSPGQRREEAVLLGEPVPAWAEGEQRQEWPGEQRRLAWFPRPVGPAHAAAVAGMHALTVPRHLPGVRTVRSYHALPGWRAELLQLEANLARIPALKRRGMRQLTRVKPPPSEELRARRRWAMVVEAANAQEHARAWANGRGLDRIAAVGALLLAEAILAGRADAGVLPPACVDVPQDLLDRLSSRTDLRWSLVRPPR